MYVEAYETSSLKSKFSSTYVVLVMFITAVHHLFQKKELSSIECIGKPFTVFTSAFAVKEEPTVVFSHALTILLTLLSIAF